MENKITKEQKEKGKAMEKIEREIQKTRKEFNDRIEKMQDERDLKVREARKKIWEILKS